MVDDMINEVNFHLQSTGGRSHDQPLSERFIGHPPPSPNGRGIPDFDGRIAFHAAGRNWGILDFGGRIAFHAAGRNWGILDFDGRIAFHAAGRYF
jgi:hypothetical protein